MSLLKHEITDAPNDSYFGYLAELIKQVKYCRTKLTVEEFKAKIPELQTIERKLQKIDIDMGDVPQDYIQVIMEELSEQDDIENNLLNEISRCGKVVFKAMFDKEFNIEEYSIDFVNKNSVIWLDLTGYRSDKPDNVEEIFVSREIFRSVCNKLNVIFIDTSKCNE